MSDHLPRMSECGCDMVDEERDDLTRALSVTLAQCAMQNASALGLCQLSILQGMVMAAMNVCSSVGLSDDQMNRDMDEALVTVRAQLLSERQRQARTHEGNSSLN